MPATDLLLRGVLAAAAATIIIAGLKAAASLLLPLVAAALIATIAWPLVAELTRHRVPTGLAVIITILLLVIGLTGPGLVIYGAAAQFAAAAPRYRDTLREVTLKSFDWLAARGIDTSGWTAAFQPGVVLDFVGGLLAGLMTLLSNGFLVLLVVAFLLMEASGLGAKARAAFGDDTEVTDRVASVIRQIHHYLIVKTIISLLTGVAAGLWTAWMGLDFAILWGLLAFLLNYIPNFGSIIAGIPPSLLALVQLGPGRMLILALGYVVINIVLGSITEPRLVGRQLQLSPLAILLSLIFWGWTWGPVGMLLAVPILMVIKITLENTKDLQWIAVLLSNKSARPAGPLLARSVTRRLIRTEPRTQPPE